MGVVPSGLRLPLNVKSQLIGNLLFVLSALGVGTLLLETLKRVVFRRQWEYVLFFLCLYLPFYISILSITYQATGSTAVLAVFQYVKEIVVLIALASFVFFLRDPFNYPLRLNIVDKLFMAFLGLATLYVFLPLGETSFFNKVAYLKNSLLMGILYLFGRNTAFSERQIGLLFKCIWGIAVAAFCLNVIEKVLDTHFQQFTGYALFNFAVNGMEPSGNYGLAWTFETQTISKRFASFFSDPLELASSCLLGFSTGLIWYLTSKRENGRLYLVLMLCSVGSLAFSSSRAAFAAFFVMVFFIAVIFRLYRLLALGAFAFLLFVLYVVYLASDDFYYFVYDTVTFQNASSVGHVLEWIMGLESMISNPLGIGLAMSGNSPSVDEDLRVGGENQFLIYGVQLGFLGMVLYISLLWVGIVKALEVFRKSPNVNHARIAFVAAVTKFGLLLPLFTANAEVYLYVSLVTWWMLGFSMKEYNAIKSIELQNRASIG